jgi:hypothetical protein
MIELRGDFSWTSIPDIKVYGTPWETFQHNPSLWTLFSSPTACYVEFGDEDARGRPIFYRDQQDCLLWSVDPATDKIYSDAQTRAIADDIEEFWLRQYLESRLWYRLAMRRQPLETAPPLEKAYADFYL